MQGRVEGLQQLRHIGKLLESEANPRKLKTAIGKEIRAAVAPVEPKAKAHARATLPKRGGLNEWVADADIKTRLNLTSRGATVKVVATRKTKKGKTARMQDIDSGTVRHRTYGRPQWFTQHVPAGWFTQPAEEAAPEVEKSLLGVLDDIAHRLTRK